jgi:hypothetical protein
MTPEKCWQCNDFGTVSAEREGYEYAFACLQCSKGRSQPEIVPRWDKGCVKRGFVLMPMYWHSKFINEEGA